jgi:hypothetical protein
LRNQYEIKKPCNEKAITPFLYSKINMIISTSIERFKTSYRFIENFWMSLEFIATYAEVEGDLEPPAKNNVGSPKNAESLLTMGENIVRQKLMEARVQKVLRAEFCEEIKANLERIKLKGLEYSEILFENLMVRTFSSPLSEVISFVQKKGNKEY